MATVKKFKSDTPILCRSVCRGNLSYVSSKSGLSYEWLGYGDTCEVMYSDLMALKSAKSPFVFAPWFIIENDELVAQWKKELEPVYAPFAGFESLDEVFSLDIEEFKELIKNSPRGFKDAVVSLACEKINDGTLDSVSIIKALDETLGTSLQILI
jgi:hypothetical protein